MDVVDRDAKALEERAGSSKRAKTRELDELLTIRYQLEKLIEGGFRYGFRTIDQISAGWDEFYRIQGCIEESGLIIRGYSQLLLELSSFSSRQEEPMRSKRSQIQERGAGVARPESQLAFPLLETGSKSTAQQQPRGQQEQFETGEKGWREDLVVKLYYEQNLSCSVGAPAAEAVDVLARVGVGTRWLVAVEDAGCGRHGHPGGESFPPFAPD